MSAAPLRLLPSQPDDRGGLEDPSFRNLLSPADWARLPEAVRIRFSKKLDGAARVYAGEVVACRMSRTGWMLAQALRLIGAPLPIAETSGLPTVVTVTENGQSGGQNWTRVYSRRSGFPQVIHSTKMFSGPTGLKEYIGTGINMALTLSVVDTALVFTSAGYFVQFGRASIRLPRWLEPGQTVVTHRDLGAGAFLFTLQLVHPLFGALIHQEAKYREVELCAAS